MLRVKRMRDKGKQSMMSGRCLAPQTGCRWWDERSGMEIKGQIQSSSRGEEEAL